jgi:putative oxygen-independent coproporphyrinogen III oxidase
MSNSLGRAAFSTSSQRGGNSRIRVASKPTPPDSARLADAAARWRSAYVHVPFCAERCPYCDFAVVTAAEGGDATMTDRYVEAVVAEIGMEQPFGPIDAVNLGGGTPSRLSGDQLRRIVAALDEHHGLADGAELSLESNPEDWTVEFGAAAVTAGFNRISLGVQSFDPAVLAALGRLHTPEKAETAVREAIGVFVTVNLDLIYGTPGESIESWQSTVDRALALEPEHLSAYALTVERGTALSRAIAAGAPAPDPDDQADKYEYLAAHAPEVRLVRYEVSNWCRPGHHCRYNLSTWAMGEFIGFGLGAHDHRDGVRSRNVRRLDAYLEQVESGMRPRAGSERLDRAGVERERLAIGLRLTAGVVPGELGDRFLAGPEGQRHLEAGTVTVDDGRLVVAKPLLTDAVARAALSGS